MALPLREVRSGVRIVRCPTCGLAFTDPVPYARTEECDVYAAEDPTHDRPRRRQEFAGYARELLAHAVANGGLRGARLLDVGCGAGELLEVARDLGAKVLGVEVNPHHRVRLCARGIAVVAALEEVHEREFDLIVLSHVLEHVPRPVPFLTELHTRLVPSGRLLVSLPNFDSYFARRLGRHWVGLQVDQHLWQFTPHSLRGLIERAGYRVLGSGEYALGRGRGPEGGARYAGADFLVDSQGSTAVRLMAASLLVADRLVLGMLGRALRRYGEQRGGDNLWLLAAPVLPATEAAP